MTRAISGLSDTATYKLPNGELITGRELKEIWSNTDFKISDGVIQSANADFDDTTRDFLINADIGFLGRMTLVTGGMNFVVLHEIGHAVSVSQTAILRAYSAGVATSEETFVFQRLANDVARFIAESAGLVIMTNVSDGFTEGSSTIIESSDTSGDPLKPLGWESRLETDLPVTWL